MNWLRGALAGAMLLLAGTVPSAQQAPWVAVLDEQGLSVMAFAARTEPYRPGLLPRVFEDFTGDQNLRDGKGRVISGIAFYGWTDGSNVRVVLLVRVPAAGADNTFYSSGDRSQLSLEEFASYRLGVGESRRIDELKSSAFGPYSIRIESRSR
jgi:hypothetical protein